MNPSIDDVIEFLRDGKWHTMTEISHQTNLQEMKLLILAEFLAAYTFLHLDRGEHRVKLSETFTTFVQETDKDERCTSEHQTGYIDIKATKLR